jgi:micrococcal nuclease
MVMTVPPNVKYAEKFLRLERTARKRNKGLWNESLKAQKTNPR